MKSILILAAFLTIHCTAAAQSQPTLYTPEQVKEKFGVEITDDNWAPVIKAIIGWMNDIAIKEEYNAQNVVESLSEMALRLPPPARNMINYLVGDFYAKYWQTNHWQIRNRTSTPDGGGTIDTWDLNRLFNEAAKYYSLVLEDAESLKTATLDDYDPILYRSAIGDTEKFKREFFTSMYDVLISNIISAFSNNLSAGMPNGEFFVDDPRFWSPAEEFIKVDIKTPELPSAEYEVLRLYQKLLAFRLQLFEQERTSANVLPLIAMDIERLKYVKSEGVYDNENDRYMAALKQIRETYREFAESEYANYELALLLKEQGDQWARGRDERWQNKYVEAYELLDKVASRWTDFAVFARDVQKEIASPSVRITIGRQQYPGEPFLALANYRNAEKMYITAYELYDETEQNTYYNDQLKWSWLGDREAVYTNHIDMPQHEDFQPRTAQFMIDGLPQGLYILFASAEPLPAGWNTTKDFESRVSYVTFQVTPLMLNSRYGNEKMFGLSDNDLKSANQIYITDAKTGKPVKNAKIDAYVEDYDFVRDRNGRFPNKLVASYRTDQTGIANISKPDNRDRFSKLEVTSPDGGELIHSERLYHSSIYINEDDKPAAYFFTDRAIYRPGQTVHYKVLLIQKYEDGTKGIIPRHNLTVAIKDINDKNYGEQTLVTNEYGSAHGSIIIPQGTLNGNMVIFCQYGRETLRVEEYKRPTFEVEFDPVERTYRFEEEVELTGSALALAGYSVDNSTVKYRVRRESNYRFMSRYENSGNINMEIASGEVRTDADGKFTIPFTASAEGMNRTNVEAVNFEVSVDVTDANGETQSASTTITIGDNPLLLQTNLPTEINNRDSLTFSVAATTLNFEPVSAEVHITVEELEGHNRILREMLWNNKPDTTLIAKPVFEKFFPHDIYAAEDDITTFPVVRLLSESQIRTAGDGSITRFELGSLGKQPAGWYRVTLRAVNDDGIEKTIVRNLRLNGTASGNKPSPITNINEWITKIKTSDESGKEVVFRLAGPRKNSLVRYDVMHDGRIVRSGDIMVGTTFQRISFPIEEWYQGGFGIQFIMVSDGRSYEYIENVTGSFPDRKLDISFATFRDQLLPGEHERWTLTVKNRDGGNEMAEMVATLYDASLDKFAPLEWPSNAYFLPQTKSYYANRWNGSYWWERLAQGSNTTTFRAKVFYIPTIWINRFNWRHTILMRNDGRANNSPEDILNSAAIVDPSYKIIWNEVWERHNWVSDNMGQPREKATFTGSVTRLASEGIRAVIDESAAEYDVIESGAGTQDIRKFTTMAVEESMENIATRQNFSETAFFYPQLRTNEEGEIVIEFTIPESLTKWNMMGFAHTKELKTGSVKNSLITQKQVAVNANAPRFFREGDRVEFTAKVFNVTENDLSGKALLRLYDAMTMQPIEGVLKSDEAVAFSAAAGQSSGLKWTLEIPEGLSAITYKLTAQAGSHTDGEEKTVPVMSNTIMLTETQPFMVRAGESRTVDFVRLREMAETVQRNHSLTLEFTSNPAWYAVLSMPYLMEFPYECSEQVFSKFYANSLSASITDNTPRIKHIFEQWRGTPDSNALLSNLEKNQELKQVLLEETPWVLQAQDETERKRRIGMLFDLNNLAYQQRSVFDKLAKMQLGNGGFAWFNGLAPSRHITQHIIAGFGQLAHLNALNADFNAEAHRIVSKGFTFLDAELQRDYAAVKNIKDFDPKKQYISYIQLHYLYSASFGRHLPEDQAQREAFDFYYAQAKAHWRKFNLYGQGLTALAFHRYGDTALAREVVAAIKSLSSRTEDMGMFWRGNRRGYFWYEAPIETQALMISVFDEAGGDPASVEEMKIWLLRNKQTNSWSTTKATADACYALLMTGSKLLDESNILDVRIGGKPLAEAVTGEVRPEAGTGYVKTVWAGSDITPEMGTLVATNTNKYGIAWGGMFWQYFEKLDNVTSAETDLRMEKQIFIKRTTPRGVELTPIADGAAVNVGDLLTVRVILRAHRDYEYVHLKDMRASGLEPARALSGYRYQDGLLYYENIKDASTNFFITTLSAGTYVFEYDLRVSHAGDFSNGVTTFQCMYAPEFSAHSGGTRLRVE